MDVRGFWESVSIEGKGLKRCIDQSPIYIH